MRHNPPTARDPGNEIDLILQLNGASLFRNKTIPRHTRKSRYHFRERQYIAYYASKRRRVRYATGSNYDISLASKLGLSRSLSLWLGTAEFAFGPMCQYELGENHRVNVTTS